MSTYADAVRSRQSLISLWPALSAFTAHPFKTSLTFSSNSAMRTSPGVLSVELVPDPSVEVSVEVLGAVDSCGVSSPVELAVVCAFVVAVVCAFVVAVAGAFVVEIDCGAIAGSVELGAMVVGVDVVVSTVDIVIPESVVGGCHFDIMPEGGFRVPPSPTTVSFIFGASVAVAACTELVTSGLVVVVAIVACCVLVAFSVVVSGVVTAVVVVVASVLFAAFAVVVVGGALDIQGSLKRESSIAVWYV